jgi:hypothetical protein
MKLKKKIIQKTLKKNDLDPPKLACKIYNLVMILG